VRTLNRRWTYAFSGRLPQPFQRVCYIKNLKKYIYPCHCPKFFVARKAQDAGLELRAPPPLGSMLGLQPRPDSYANVRTFCRHNIILFFLGVDLGLGLSSAYALLDLSIWTWFCPLDLVLCSSSSALIHIYINYYSRRQKCMERLHKNESAKNLLYSLLACSSPSSST